jgi:hypothetical protein
MLTLIGDATMFKIVIRLHTLCKIRQLQITEHSEVENDKFNILQCIVEIYSQELGHKYLA